jgi:hypothetical protein
LLLVLGRKNQGQLFAENEFSDDSCGGMPEFSALQNSHPSFGRFSLTLSSILGWSNDNFQVTE